MIEVRDLVKKYGTHTAVNSVTFDAQPGEIVGLLGPNGAGKTTTMRILTGYMPPTTGSVRVSGYDVVEDSMAVRQNVGYMPEQVPIYPDMTVESYVMFWARMRGLRRPKQRVREVLERFGIANLRRTLVRNLSKGLRQRLGLAQAVVHQPNVIILDEPTIGIDPKQVIEVREYVQSLRDDHTVLFSSHILSEVEQICDRVVILNRGKIVAAGTTEILSKQMRPGDNLFVALKGAKKAHIRQQLADISGVQSVHASKGGFILHSDEDIREDVLALTSAQKLKLVEMRSVEITLEDIFLNIVE